ncbi:uncharacterized protein A4U43_C10F14450 [Asparagus officinalis]|uniref:Rad21/Rec8-like protein N-terminal domain-containing protein n=1 Tax=Asparagus officinalis TaxID=4686 RepID=A0A5P1E2P2_ASPOF|nr:sister chromatid cohesion 1 protein 4-like [Asparagus officinalis]ONK56901.1 uncharacterized protein A4U43_C10F14450 [Asparagus officinalis]
MFYSQFILAKKGTLGTIWIAAHLERKLKKNQVADTDIGDSVDSILFPDVPIALRLSSHLLLGVVRIYSKKVNYLFHDCSEALLNVKQAFRSTAVDLPPEESTAPYHSITLPETFDLDDFELPDSALLNGNFDDRHVSTREQITLQDTVDGTGYSTSQFGLDDRFGDGDASQIGLELDEELLLENNLTLQDAQVLDSDVHQGDGTTDLTKMDTEECQHGHDEYRNDGASMELSELLCNKRGKHVLFSHAENVNGHDDSSHRLIFNIQTPDLNEVFLSDDHIGGPSAAHDTDMEYAGDDPPSPEFNESANFPFKPGSVLAINDACHKHDANNVLGVSSTTSVLTELHPLASQTLGVILPGSDAAGSNIIASETSDPKMACISQVLPCSNLVSDSLIPQRSGETIAAPAAGLGWTSKTADTLNDGITCSEENARLISVGNKMMSGVNLDMDRIAVQDITRLSNLDQGRIEDAHSCQTSNFSALSSDFHLRSCTSESNQTNLISPEVIVQKGDQGMSFREQPSILETAVEDQEMHFSRSSMTMQAFGSAIAVDTNLGVHQKSNDMLLGMTSVNNPMDLSSSSISKDVQSGHGNCFSTSEFSEPERMRFALSGNVGLLNDVGQQTTEKEVTESDGSVDRISNVSGQKHYLMDITPDLQNGISPKISGIPQKKRKNDYIPNDDDLLASILVGRTPAFIIGPTPPLPKPPPSKRPRLTTKVGFPKRRKVLLDDTVVLHADTIRQQLINTEDIRRMRKKVPCTRPEIWRIQKSLLKDDLFSETIFTGVSEELNRLLTRIYDLGRTVHSQTNRQHLSEAEHELELSKSLGFVRNNDGMADQSAVVPKRVYGESQGPSGTPELIDTQNCKNAVNIDAQGRSEFPLDQLDPSQNTTSRTELGALGISSNECALPTDSRIEEKHDDICPDPDQNSHHELVEVNNNTLHVGESTSFEDFTSDYAAGDGVINNNIVLGATSNNILLEVDNFSNSRAASITVEDMGVDMIPVPSLDCPLDSVQAIGLVDGRPDTREYHDMKESEDGRLTDGCETAVDEERPISVVSCREKPTSESERVVSAVGENSCMNIESGPDVESAHMELAATRESSDFCSAIDDIDTDFLNADDEVEYDEETNNDVPNHEPQSLDTGWSSRTRGVARYLKNMFDQESGHGRKSVAIDHLLTGKTRKEASRMFFETLVLKTKDYIQVEQEKAFDRVNINPRIKLLKSGF